MKFFQYMIFLFSTVIFLLFLPFSAVAGAIGDIPKISAVTPAGTDVAAGRQISIQFNQDMVPLGRMARTAAETFITISPAVTGQWRWLSPSLLALQMDEAHALQPATPYTLTVHPGFKALSGATMKTGFTHTFTTRRPRITWTHFRTWQSPGTPVMAVHFNLPVAPASVKAHLFLKEADPPHTRHSVTVTAPPENSSERVWWISPATELPLDTAMRLQVSPGLVTPQGPAPGTEQRTVVKFHTFPPFAFLGLSCYAHGPDRPLHISPRQFSTMDPSAGPETLPPTARALLADPRAHAELLFSAPVAFQEIRDRVTITPDPAQGRQDYDPWANRYSGDLLNAPHSKRDCYAVALPLPLQPWQGYHLKEKDALIRDAFGRKLDTPLDFIFFTDHRKSGFQILHPHGVLEKEADTRLPMAVTNISDMKITWHRVTAADTGATASDGAESSVTAADGTLIRHNLMVQDLTRHVPMGIRNLLDNRAGAVAGRITRTIPATTSSQGRQHFLAQVSPWQIHAKIGHFNTLVWVTRLSTGQPAAGAEVTLHRDLPENLTGNAPALARGITDENGIVMLPGALDLDPDGATLDRWWENDRKRLIIRVIHQKDLALLPLTQAFAVDTWKVSGEAFDSWRARQYGHIHTWGTTPQGIYRAGDTLQYKIYVRDQDNTTFIAPPPGPYSLTLKDPSGKTVLKREKIRLSAFNALNGAYTLPENSQAGWYRFQLTADFTDETWFPLQVLVSDFSPSPFKVTTTLNGPRFSPGQTLEVETRGLLHAGGPFSDAQARVVVSLKEKVFHSARARGFSFYNPFTDDGEGEKSISGPSQPLLSRTDKLDSQGRLSHTLPLAPSPVAFGTLTVESAVQDDRGKSVAATATATYLGRDRFAGLKSTRWVFTAKEPATVEALVVDDKGAPLGNVPFHVRIQRLETRATRVKGAGNAYLTRYTHQWITVQEMDLDTTDDPCPVTFTPEQPGDYRIFATVTDTRGRSHTAGISTWVTGQGHVVWQEPADYRLQIIPEQTTVSPGETARYLIKNPFPGAQALITLERYGILKKWVQRLEQATAVIEVPITRDLARDFFFSATLFSPRVAPPPDGYQVDLGKPTFRTGYVRTQVTLPDNGISVAVATDRAVYKPGDTVTLSLSAAAAGAATAQEQGAPPREPVEFAVAVLDEAVFDLMARGKSHFDIHKGFYTLDGLDVGNYSLLTHLAGRRLFEKKGATAGGDGGMVLDMRAFFKFVSYWNPSLKADARGRASATFTLPDNLTGWRIFAMAATPTHAMGLGQGRFTVNRPTELRPVLPNQVTAGDNFQAGFSIMNRTDTARELRVTLTANGPEGMFKRPSLEEEGQTPSSGTSASQVPLIHHTLRLDPYKRKTLYLPLTVHKAGTLTLSATARDDKDGDGLTHTLQVHPRLTRETCTVQGMVPGNSASVPLQYPENMVPGSGTLRLQLTPTLLDQLDMAFRYLKDYPYACWEQQLTRSVMAALYTRLESHLSHDLSWEDAQALPADTLARSAAFQAPNGGMAYFKPDNQRVSPYLSAFTALAFQWLESMGYPPPVPVKKALQAYLKTLLRRHTVPDFYSPGMAATVRAVALAALALDNRLFLADLERYQPHVREMSLFGQAHFLVAASRVKGAQAMARDTWTSILAQSVQSGGKIYFNEPMDPVYGRILNSPARTLGAILWALTLQKQGEETSPVLEQTAMKLVRAINQSRKATGTWYNTQANLYCVNGLAAFSRRFETLAPDMKVTARLDRTVMGEARFTAPVHPAVTFTTPLPPGQASQAGDKKEIHIDKKGSGPLYYQAGITWSPRSLPSRPVNAGMEIHREYAVQRKGHWMLLKEPMAVATGERVRVDLFLSLPGESNFVVVDDPVPGGLEPINQELATASHVDAAMANASAPTGTEALWPPEGSLGHQAGYRNRGDISRWYFYHRELGHHRVRFHADHLPPGNYVLSYMAQAICQGNFTVLPVQALEMYDPDHFGKGKTRQLQVE